QPGARISVWSFASPSWHQLFYNTLSKRLTSSLKCPILEMMVKTATTAQMAEALKRRKQLNRRCRLEPMTGNTARSSGGMCVLQKPQCLSMSLSATRLGKLNVYPSSPRHRSPEHPDPINVL